MRDAALAPDRLPVLPLPGERRVALTALVTLIDVWLQRAEPAVAQRTLVWLVEHGVARFDDSGPVLRLRVYGVGAEMPAAGGTPALLRVWQDAARDRLARP